MNVVVCKVTRRGEGEEHAPNQRAKRAGGNGVMVKLVSTLALGIVAVQTDSDCYQFQTIVYDGARCSAGCCGVGSRGETWYACLLGEHD